MAIMAGEAITEGGTSGLRGARSARRARRRGEPIQDRTKGGRGRPANRRYERDSYGYGRVLVEEPDELYEPGGGGGRGGRNRQRGLSDAYARQAREVGRNARVIPGGRPSHQGAILAEFIVAILIIVLTPIATGGSGGLSPYSANDLKRMVAIGAVYFGLALVPGDNGSKVAAWAGFLILVVLLMNALQAGHLATLLDVFSQGGSEPPGATSPTG